METTGAWGIKVTDRKTFEEFIALLRVDFNENKYNWVNNRLDLFLEAMEAYTADLDGYYKNMERNENADIPSWKVFADIMRGAVVYE